MLWPFSTITQKLDVLLAMLTAQGRTIMARFDDVDAALSVLGREVGETADQIKKLRDEVAALRAQLPGISEAELSTKLDAVVASLAGAAQGLDDLQDKLPEPTPA